MSRSDTHIGIADSDTKCLRIAAGQRVRITVGCFKGMQGIVIEPRAIGRALIRVGEGICIEIHQYCLQVVSPND